MESNLLRSTKKRLIRELQDSIDQNSEYNNRVKVYSKFPYAERNARGVVLKNASSSRIRLSADDYCADLKSIATLCRAENSHGSFLDWIVEDRTNLTSKVIEEDLSSQITGTTSLGTTRLFYTSSKPIISGFNNLKIADNFRQIVVTLDGSTVYAESIDGKLGAILLPVAPRLGQVLKVTYFKSNLTPPGRYYITLLDQANFVIDPLYLVEDELVIQKTTGTELTARVANGNLYGSFDVLYTKKYDRCDKFQLIRGTDYTIDSSGLITFLLPLESKVTLYASYRWVGDTQGPFPIPDDFNYDNTSIPGIVLCFGNQKVSGDKAVVIVYSSREPSAKVYSGHWSMSFDIDVFARDPLELPDLTDFIIDDMWCRKRLKLISEGITIEEMNPTGESEEEYDSGTSDLYYKNSISMSIMTEWQRFVPYLTKIMDFDTQLNMYLKQSNYLITPDNRVLDLNLTPVNKPFEVKYPEVGYPRIF